MMLDAIVAYVLIATFAWIAYGQYCERRNRSIFFSANVNPNVTQNVGERVAQNIAQNEAERRQDG